MYHRISFQRRVEAELREVTRRPVWEHPRKKKGKIR